MKSKSAIIEYINKLLVNPTARVPWLMLGGALLNMMYIGTNAVSAIIYRSLWSITLTFYHLVLIVIRLYLFFCARLYTDDRPTLKICLRVGLLLLALDLASAMMMLYSIRQGSYTKYSGLILIGFLIFTVYSVTRSVLDLKKHGEKENHLYFAARSISLSTSLMSIFNLHYSVLSFLGAEPLLNGRAVYLLGAAVFSTIFLLSLRLIRIGKSGSKK